MDKAPDSSVIAAVTAWFDVHERALPWRSTGPWGVLVSEFMLQQTPVDRVLPVWTTWMERWPQPASLAHDSLAEVLRAWGRLGYPRRAQRLHETARIITERHDGQVPESTEELRALPGVGDYTAAAVQAFAFGRRSIVLDTNVRRVLSRTMYGSAQAKAHITSTERQRMDALWPLEDQTAARWSAAVMELGAVVCTARNPSCPACPVQPECAWHAQGRPESVTAPRRQASDEGSDRQVRGRLLAILRESPEPVPGPALAGAWPDSEQRERALSSLLADALVVESPPGHYALPL